MSINTYIDYIKSKNRNFYAKSLGHNKNLVAMYIDVVVIRLYK